MSKIDKSTFNVKNIVRAISLITRIPIKSDFVSHTNPKTDISWAYPIVGIILAIPISILGYILLTLGFDSGVISGVLIITLVFLTGAMHEDGLADTADGFWGGWTKDARLEIMKDSRIGTYGVLALVFSILLRWYCLKLIIDQNLLFVAVTVSIILSRSLMSCYMWVTPNAKEKGLSFNTGRPNDISAIVAFTLGAAVTLLMVGFTGIFLLVLGSLLVWLSKIISLHKIDGQTGDTIGAVQQICELVILLSIYFLVG